MMVNRYEAISHNLEAIRRFDTIQSKNRIAYFKTIGGVTMPFFPFNILILPFIIPAVVFKNAQLSDYLLKMNYYFMIAFYFIFAMVMAVPCSALLYLKLIAH